MHKKGRAIADPAFHYLPFILYCFCEASGRVFAGMVQLTWRIDLKLRIIFTVIPGSIFETSASKLLVLIFALPTLESP
jgi:hypothetical protein